jgi:hypothetical protein
MNTYALLLTKISLTTVAFSVLLLLAIAATTIIFQDSGHPDHWKMTTYDFWAGILVGVLYIATVAWKIRSTLKKKSDQRQ